MIEIKQFNEWTKAEILVQVKKEEYWNRLICSEDKEGGVKVGSKREKLKLLSENDLRLLFLISCDKYYYVYAEPFDFEEYVKEMRYFSEALDEGVDAGEIELAFLRRKLKWPMRKLLWEIASLSLPNEAEKRIVWKYIYDKKYLTNTRNWRNFNWDEAIKKLRSEEGDDLYRAYMRVVEKRRQKRNEEETEISQ